MLGSLEVRDGSLVDHDIIGRVGMSQSGNSSSRFGHFAVNLVGDGPNHATIVLFVSKELGCARCRCTADDATAHSRDSDGLSRS